jgi:hypothetical protein
MPLRGLTMNNNFMWFERNVYIAIDETNLTEKEISIINLKMQNFTYRKIAEIHTLSHERIRQIYLKSLIKINRVYEEGINSKYHKLYDKKSIVLPMLESIYFDGKSPLNFFPKVSK